MRADPLRLWLASFAYAIMCAVRRIGLAGTKLAAATCGTIRMKLLKIGALVTISVRRVKLAFATACPERDVLQLDHQKADAARRRLTFISWARRRQITSTPTCRLSDDQLTSSGGHVEGSSMVEDG